MSSLILTVLSDKTARNPQALENVTQSLAATTFDPWAGESSN